MSILDLHVGSHVLVNGETKDSVVAKGTIVGQGIARMPSYYDIDDIFHPSKDEAIVLVRVTCGGHLTPAMWVDVISVHPDNIEVDDAPHFLQRRFAASLEQPVIDTTARDAAERNAA